jgi:hypothetical protein
VKMYIVFSKLTGMGKMAKPKKLLHAPFTLHAQLINYIDEEIANAKEGKSAQIIVKVNALTEVQLINKLYEASQAGVQIDLIIRSICCLRPGFRTCQRIFVFVQLWEDSWNIHEFIILVIMVILVFIVQVQIGWIVIYLIVLKHVSRLKILH